MPALNIRNHLRATTAQQPFSLPEGPRRGCRLVHANVILEMVKSLMIPILRRSTVLFFAAISLIFGQAPQTSAPAQAASPSPAQTAAAAAMAQFPTSDFQGSVPQGHLSIHPIPLSLEEAIDRGLHANLGLLTARESSEQIRAAHIRALSALLPSVSGQAGETVQQVDLQTIGITFPGVPRIIGPFSYQSALATANVPVFNYGSIAGLRSSREQQKAAALSIKNARDLVVLGVANAYLQIIADSARIIAIQAEVEADNAVYTNAVRRHEAGTAIGIDVLRSQVELKQRQQALVAQQNQFQIDKLALGRVIGLPIGQDFTVTDPSLSVSVGAIPLDEALQKAYDNRPDYQAAKARVAAAKFLLTQSRAERYPTLQLQGYYGDEGLHLFSNSHGVFELSGSVQFNIFDGGRIRSDVLQSSTELQNSENELENLKGQIDYDVRSSLLNMKSAAEQVDVAKSNIDLANKSLQESRDRFSAGVTNTVEVVQAQQAVAEANDNLISAQYAYNIAKVSLARAVGIAEQGVRAYFNHK